MSGRTIVWWVRADSDIDPQSNHDLFVDEVDAHRYASKQVYKCDVVPLVIEARHDRA